MRAAAACEGRYLTAPEHARATRGRSGARAYSGPRLKRTEPEGALASLPVNPRLEALASVRASLDKIVPAVVRIADRKIIQPVRRLVQDDLPDFLVREHLADERFPLGAGGVVVLPAQGVLRLEKEAPGPAEAGPAVALEVPQGSRR